MNYDSKTYREYLTKHFNNYLGIDIDSLNREGSIVFYLEYLDDYLLLNEEDALTYEEKVVYLESYMLNLDDVGRKNFTQIYLTNENLDWNYVKWEIFESEDGKINLKVFDGSKE